MIAEIERRGGRAVLFSTIRITEPDSWKACDDAIGNLGLYYALVFTSVNGVRGFLQRCAFYRIGNDRIRRLHSFAVGKKTKDELMNNGLSVDCIPSEYSAAALVHELTRFALSGRRVLFPRGNIGREEVVDALAAIHATVDAVTVYNTIPASTGDAGAIADEISSGRIDVVTFASPSAATNFFSSIPGNVLSSAGVPVRLAAIGPTTETSLKQMGYSVDIVAKESTSDGLVEAIDSYFS